MATLLFTVYLLNSIVVSNYLEPKKESDVIYFSVLVPTLMFVFTLLLYARSTFDAGRITASAIIPIIVSTVVLYARLYKVYKGEKITKFPMVALIFVLMGSGISYYEYTLDRRMEVFQQRISMDFDENGEISIVDKIIDIDTSKYTLVEDEDISYQISKKYIINSETDSETQETLYHHSSRDGESSISVITSKQASVISYVKDDIIRNLKINDRISIINVIDGKFKTYPAFEISYDESKGLIKNKIIIFKAYGLTIVISVHSYKSIPFADLNHIEKTLVIKYGS